MDPYYELFSTPPEHMAPLNERDKNKQQKITKPRRQLTKLSQPTEELRFSPPKQTYTPKKIDLEGKISLRQKPHKKGEGAFTSTPTRSRTRGATMIAAVNSATKKTATNHIAKRPINSNKRGSISFDYGKSASKAGSSKQQQQQQQHVSSSMKQPQDIWEKCMKTNPELQNYIDKFNQSLEVALKNPLDIRLINED